ncbi:MAG: hypothetical protein K2I77_01300 [Anaeroplasmataceae bacterium]|nr:hypothetical protein [Anaeroplasmataceae bacterium]
MKKSLILISFLVLILSLSSCNKDKTENDDKDSTEQIDIDKGKPVDEVSIKLEDKTINLNNKMEGKELYQTLFQGLVGRDVASFIFDQGQGNGVRPCQASWKENSLERYKNAISEVGLINGEEQYERTTVYNNYILGYKEDSFEQKVFLEKTIDGISNVKGTKEDYHNKTTVFGEQTKILSTDEDYNPEYNPMLQYNDKVYYSSNEIDAPSSGIYEKKYTSPLDHIDNKVSTEMFYRESYYSLLNYAKAPSIKTKFNSSIYNCDEWIDDYLQYEYELTDQYIILNYHALFDIIGVFEKYESTAIFTDLKELIEEDHQNGSYYEVIAYIDYHNETFAQNESILCDYLVEDWYHVRISKGTYEELYYPQYAGTEYDIYSKVQIKYTWKPLDISEAEIEKKKTELIDSLK